MPDNVEIDPAAVGALVASVKGPVLGPADSGYDACRTVWNGMIDRRPALVLRCVGTADVIAGVNFAREHGLAPCIKGGGHNISGLAVADGGLLLDLSLMRGVWVDPAAKLARAQAGCLLGDVDRETQLHGLAAVLGFVSNTGVAGLTLGGGFGYLSRRGGWTCDTLRSCDVVTADGRLVRASEDEHADLFWALRGGGGNFGVVTGFEYELLDVGPDVVAGAIAWPAEEADRIIDLYREVMASAPPELTCVLGFRIAPPAPWLAKSIHGKPIVLMLVCHSGSVVDGERLAAPIKQFGAPVGDVVQRRPYTTQQNLLDATQPSGRRYYWKSEFVPELDRDLLTAAAGHAATTPSPHSAILIFPFDGILNRMPPGHSPAGNREAKAVFNVAAGWDSPDDDAVNIAWARETWDDLRRFSTGGTYINFLNEEDGSDRIRSAYGPHLARLERVKAAWDPGNLFCANKNVVPAER